MLALSELSRTELEEMQKVVRERGEEDYKRNIGLKNDTSKGIRYQ